MSYEEKVSLISLEANGDQSANQYKFMLLGATGIALNTVAGGPCVGVLQDKPTAGKIGAVAVGGVAKVLAGGVITRGDNVQSSATGLAETAASADYSQGIALETAASGDVIPILLRPQAQLN
jgi:hypothetical protein